VSASRVEQLAAAVADGESIDWESAQSSLGSEDERAVAAQLQSLSSLSADDAALDTAVAARLPLVLRLAKALAIAKCVIGVAGYLVTWALEGRNSPPVFLLGIGVFAGTAVWLDVTGRDDRRAQALAGVYWTSAASFAHGLMYALPALAIFPVGVTLLRSIQPEAFFPLFLWQFARDFPSVTRFGVIDRLSRVGVVTGGVAALTLFVANIAVRVPSVIASLPALSVLDRSHESSGRWFWLIVFATAIAALVWIVVRGELAERAERRRVRMFLWSIVAGVAPVAIMVAIESTWSGIASFMRTDTGRIIGAVIVYPPMFAFPLATAYVVLAHDVLDITSAAQRALRYLLTRWLVAWGTSVPVAILLIVVYLHRAEPLAEVLSTPHSRLLLWMAAAGGALMVFRGPLLRVLDRWMLRGVSDPATMLAELGTELRTARTLMELSMLVARATERTMQTDVGVYFIEESDTLVCATGDDDEASRNSLVPVLLKGMGGPCVVGPHGRGSCFGLLSPGDRRWIQRQGIMALCPVMPSSAGRVRAVIALKARRNALSLSGSDEQFLAAVCAAAALAHARLEQMAQGAAPLQEELAIQCSHCARVEAWRPAGAPCACGGVWERAALPDIVAGRFRLEALLGAGGMGVVYRAQDLILHRHVAVKTVPRLSGDAAERLLDEARAMAAMSHAHIAVLYGAEQWRGTPVLMVEYLANGTLSHRLRGGQIPIDAAVEIASRLAEALVYMHATDRFHGDIKPSNIGFSATDVVKFLDFGLSRTMKLEGGEEFRVGGTLAYLSPDVLEGAPAGPASDLWALSVALFQMLTGYHPFLNGADTVASIRAGFQDSGRVRALLPRPVADLLCGLLTISPGERPDSAMALLERLTAVRIALAERSHV
jgi:hypothetical protein